MRSWIFHVPNFTATCMGGELYIWPETSVNPSAAIRRSVDRTRIALATALAQM
jgi:hypothetical protein